MSIYQLFHEKFHVLLGGRPPTVLINVQPTLSSDGSLWMEQIWLFKLNERKLYFAIRINQNRLATL